MSRLVIGRLWKGKKYRGWQLIVERREALWLVTQTVEQRDTLTMSTYDGHNKDGSRERRAQLPLLKQLSACLFKYIQFFIQHVTDCGFDRNKDTAIKLYSSNLLTSNTQRFMIISNQSIIPCTIIYDK